MCFHSIEFQAIVLLGILLYLQFNIKSLPLRISPDCVIWNNMQTYFMTLFAFKFKLQPFLLFAGNTSYTQGSLVQ